MEHGRFSWASRNAAVALVLMVSISKLSTPVSSCRWKSSASAAVNTIIGATIKLIVALPPSGAAMGGGCKRAGAATILGLGTRIRIRRGGAKSPRGRVKRRTRTQPQLRLVPASRMKQSLTSRTHPLRSLVFILHAGLARSQLRRASAGLPLALRDRNCGPRARQRPALLAMLHLKGLPLQNSALAPRRRPLLHGPTSAGSLAAAAAATLTGPLSLGLLWLLAARTLA